MRRLTLHAIALSTAAGIAACASAQTPRLTWQFSTDRGTNWQSSGFVVPNSIVSIRAVVDWSSVSAYGLFGLLHKVVIENVDPLDGGALVAANGVGNRIGAFTYGAATLAARTSGTTQRIVALGVNGREEAIPSAQSAPRYSLDYNASPLTPIFQFDFVIGSIDQRTLVFRSEVASNESVQNAFGFHASAASTQTDFRLTGESVALNLLVIPAPGTLAAVGIAACALRRHRRVHAANAR